MNDVEVWVKVEGFDYSISNRGRCRNDRTGKIIKPYKLPPKGYMTVALYKDGERHPKYVHILVAEAFLKRYNEGLVVDHIDGDVENNTLQNIRFISQSHNVFRVKGRPVEAWKDGVCVATYPCVRCTPQEFHPASICRTIRNGKPYKGFYWRYQ